MSTLHIPSSCPAEEILLRTTHLGIGAHQDDLEFMAYHGIATCYDSDRNWFTGVTCTSGGGSSRSGPFANHSDEEMQKIRHKEQIKAANIGKYAAQYQLGHSSAAIKGTGYSALVKELATIIQETQPTVLYTHNPTDKHPSHLAVFAATLQALRTLPSALHPFTFLGCEVWRDLDWLPDQHKVRLDVSPYPELASELNQCFQSQIAGGKNYHHAIIGRRTAHATFSDPHAGDEVSQLTFALDLLPLLKKPSLSPAQYCSDLITEFHEEVESGLGNYEECSFSHPLRFPENSEIHPSSLNPDGTN